MREAGITLLFASAILASVLFIPRSGSLTSDSNSVSQTSTLTASSTPDAFANMSIEAQAAIVYDLTTDEALFAKNADAQLPLASLTKLLTVYGALAVLSPDTPVTISAGVIGLDGPHAFSVGQEFALADLARLTLTASLNDGAAAIAEAAATRENLSQSGMLAAAASALRLSQTYAVNGSGLDVNKAVSGGYGSARDLARLAGALVERAPDIALATTRSSAEAVSFGGTRFSVVNTDPFVGTIPRLLLSKTGYTDLAGGNLALVVDVGIRYPIAIIVLGSSSQARFSDGRALVAAVIAHFAGVSSL